MKNILVIDDDKAFVSSIKASLDLKRYSIISAGDGVEGLEKMKERKPDLVLLDIKMPRMDGMEFLRKMNEIYGEGKINVLITTNVSSLENISEGVELGVRGYFIKSNESLKGIARIIDGVFK